MIQHKEIPMKRDEIVDLIKSEVARQLAQQRPGTAPQALSGGHGPTVPPR